MSTDNVSLDYIDLQLNDVEASDGGFDTLTPGEYVFEATKVAGGQSAAGNPKMVVTYKVIDAVTDVDACQAEVGKEVVQSYALKSASGSDYGRRRIKSLVVALGVELDARGGFDPNHLIGGRMVAEIKIEQYNEVNPVTQVAVAKTSQKIIRERPDDSPVEDEAPAPEPVAKAPEPARGRGRGRRAAAPPAR